MNKDINYKKFEDELLQLSPHLSKQEAEDIIQKLFTCWEDIIENIDLFEK